QRILDERLRLLREQAVETAVERHACDHGDRDHGDRGDDGEQGDDAHVQSRRRASATPRLHDSPHLARDDQNQKKDGDCVRKQQRDHDLVGGRNRRQAGEHDEGQERRQQRQRNGGKTKRSRNPSRRRRRGGSDKFGGGGFADVHRLISSQTGTRRGAKTRPFRCPPLIDGRVALMLLYNNVAEKRQYCGHKDFGSTFGKCGSPQPISDKGLFLENCKACGGLWMRGFWVCASPKVLGSGMLCSRGWESVKKGEPFPSMPPRPEVHRWYCPASWARRRAHQLRVEP